MTTLATIAVAGTAQDAVAAVVGGQYARIVNTSTTDNLHYLVNGTAAITDEYLPPNQGVSIPLKLVNAISVVSATAGHPFTVYVGVIV